LKMKINQEDKKLIRRYLIWCYKTLKEDLDCIDRKFTQLQADYKVLNYLSGKGSRAKGTSKEYNKLLDEFKAYIRHKEDSAVGIKFVSGKKGRLQPEYQFLIDRLGSVEKTIDHFLGRKELKKIQALYEEEMTRRILEAREHT